jgi:hypothetical protein
VKNVCIGAQASALQQTARMGRISQRIKVANDVFRSCES